MRHSLVKPFRQFPLLDFLLVFFSSFFVYLLTLYPTVGTEDSGELIVSAANLDIAHPPGYPLHTLLGWVFSKVIFFGNIGWRVNLMSAFFGALTVTILYFIIKRITRNDILAFCSSLFFAFSDIFWSQAIRTEVYTLDMFFLAGITYLLLLWHDTEKRRYLYLTALAFGLSMCNHHMMMLAAPPIFLFVLVRNWRVIINPKIVLTCLLLLSAGLLPYAYLPIRTAVAPYDNPAYIKHESLQTWDKFSAFVNRNIYGGTVSVKSTSGDTEESQPEHTFLDDLSSTFQGYFWRFINNNINGFIPMMKIVFSQLFFLPLILFLPGVYFMAKKTGKYSVYVFSLFIFYSIIQLTFITMAPNLHPLTVFGNRPFCISAIFALLIISSAGIALIINPLKNRILRLAASLILILMALFPLLYNFTSNNESKNYIAHDFSANLLNSLPENAYLLSTGKDNLTFPLYYLEKIEKLRPDTTVEIYYGRTCVTKDLLDQKLEKSGQAVMFIDLLPCGYNSLDLVPYNFVYAYGDMSALPPSDIGRYTLRGLREKMDYPNSRLKGLYYLKLAYAATGETAAFSYIDLVQKEIPENEQFKNFISDYLQSKDDTGMF